MKTPEAGATAPCPTDARARFLPLTIADYDEVIALWRACEGIGLSDADERERIAAYLARNPGMSFVARVDGVLAGAVLCGHDGRRGYLHHLAVDARFRRLGLGRQLTERCLAALTAAGIRKCHLFVLEGNRDGLAYWQTVGWTRRTGIAIHSIELDGASGDACPC